MENLANACGEKSIIRLCNKLFSLLNCSYVPGASLAEHLISFRKDYTALKTSIVSNPGFMTVSTGLAAALLLRSLHQDNSLNSLVQSLYEIKLLTFEKVYDRLLIEETRKESATAETTYYSSQLRKFNKSSVDQPRIPQWVINSWKFLWYCSDPSGSKKTKWGNGQVRKNVQFSNEKISLWSS